MNNYYVGRYGKIYYTNEEGVEYELGKEEQEPGVYIHTMKLSKQDKEKLKAYKLTN